MKPATQTPVDPIVVANSAEAGRAFLVDDDPLIAQTVARLLKRAHYEVSAFSGGAAALAALETEREDPDVVLLDLHMPEMDGIEVLRRLREEHPEVPVVMLTGDASVRPAIDAIRLGAYDYLTKPFEGSDDVIMTIGRAVERRRLERRNRQLERQLEVSDRFEGILGTTRAMRAVFKLVESVAPTDATVLLLGESGTGKELLARAIHTRSHRRGRVFIPINCSALTETLLESELFGHVRGAFSGANTSRKGVFEEASGGTLFLDEIGDISPATQVRLLRALQEGEIKPVGASDIRKVDVRVIAATNRDLQAAVRDGTFRQDLYYRLNVMALEIPPLRQRAEDIPLLAQHFLQRYSKKFGKKVARLDPGVLEALQAHRFPGNIRELENIIQRAVVLAEGDVLLPEHLPPAVAALAGQGRLAKPSFDQPFSEAKQVATDTFERRYVEDVLARASGNVALAARLSGLDKSNFRRIARRHGIDAGRFRDG